MNIEEAVNVVAGIEVKSEYEAIAKEIVLAELDNKDKQIQQLQQKLKYFEEED